MMKVFISRNRNILTALFVFLSFVSVANPTALNGILSGNLQLDETWSSAIYLSYIPTFDDMYLIANDAIVSETNIDSIGNYSFDIGFLPEKDNLFRLHIVKKGEPANTLIIGGKDENHLFLLANCYSNIEINNCFSTSPFKNISVNKSHSNIAFRKITNLTFEADSIANESGIAKERFIENQLYTQLMNIADTSSNPLVSLYAIYNSDFETNYKLNLEFFNSYLKRWENQKNSYFDAFRKKISPSKEESNIWLITLLVVFLILTSFYIGKWTKKNDAKLKKLSVQERRVLELLKKRGNKSRNIRRL